MKKLHLVCNSHLDPVWQWDWDEGAAAALATFYSAVRLAEKYDYIFCHNEVILYEYIERFDPVLFEEITELIKAGKWHIMGGWYDQPDCLVPSGESFMRQISLGKEYFTEKFNTFPKTGINFDAFGHTKGLPQILKKSGYESYLFCRPLEWFTWFKEVPHGPFMWEGYDGSKIKALRQEDMEIYLSQPGQARDNIIRKAKVYENDKEDDMIILWGVGNHGGVNSEKDLNDIIALTDEKKGTWEIVHSTPDDYFASVTPTQDFSQELIAFIKSYSSVNAIKKAHDNLENAIYRAERFLSMLGIAGIYKYDKEVFKNAERALCQIEFHDVLSGTSIKTGNDSSIAKALTAIQQVNGEFYNGYFRFSGMLPKAKDGDDCFVVLNPHPYEVTTVVETELFETVPSKYKLHMYDSEGNTVDSQVILEESMINISRRKRLIYKYTYPAMSVTQFGIHSEVVEVEPPRYAGDTSTDDIIIKDDVKQVKISRSTGLIESYIQDGKEYAAGNLFNPIVFDDNEDPWGWRMCKLGTNFRPMQLDTTGKGLFEGLKGVTILEDGPVLTQVEALFSFGESHVIVDYKFYHGLPYMDVNAHVIWNSRMKGLKFELPLCGKQGYFTQAAYGTQYNENDGDEKPGNRFVGVENGENAFVVYNRSGIHSYTKEGKKLYLTLLNGSAYCAHPTDPGVPLIVDETRYTKFIEVGTHDFSFRLGVNKVNECEKYAQEFNQPLYSVLTFPHGKGNAPKELVTLSNENVVMTACKRRKNGTYLVRLHNNYKSGTSTTIQINGVTKEIRFKKYEFKTFVYNGKTIRESKDAALW
ncbi:MAG: hypothetical protein IJE23_05160 [Tyzzerella sp.]|nr:hypothetical protein [Tyzzerella sp.]